MTEQPKFYTRLMSTLAKQNQLDRALEVFDIMRESEVAADTIAYSMLISACRRQRRSVLARVHSAGGPFVPDMLRP